MNIAYLVGEKKLKPVEFRLVERDDGHWIETDLVRLGPIADKVEAVAMLRIARTST